MNTWAALNALANLGLILSILNGLWASDRCQDAYHQNDRKNQERFLLRLIINVPIFILCVFSMIYCSFQLGK